MSTPGSNVLALALTAIAPQPVEYRAYTGKTTRADGQQVAAFAAPVTLYGSWQAVPSSDKAAYGLTLSMDYAVFYASTPMQNAVRDEAPDQFTYAGRRWSIVSRTGWFVMDGWDSVLVVDIGPEPTPEP
jgi:hypothetical protein